MPHALRRRTALTDEAATTPATSPHTEGGLRAWWSRNVVAVDPHPETGLLDRLDHESAPDRLRPTPFEGEVQRVA